MAELYLGMRESTEDLLQATTAVLLGVYVTYTQVVISMTAPS